MAKRKPSRKKSAPTKRSRSRAKRRTPKKAAGQATNSATHTDHNRNHVEIQVGTAQQNIVRARRLYEDELAKLFIRKRNAKSKRDRTKISKKMRDVAGKINRLR